MTTRIGGLSSGLDTQSVIEALLEAKSVPVTNLENRVAEEEEKLSAYDTLSSKANSLQDAAYELSLYSLWNQKKATSSDTDVATATATATATKGDYTLKVDVLAKAHRIGSTVKSSSTQALGLTGDFTISGQTISVESSDTLEDVRDAINTAALSMDEDKAVKSYIVTSSDGSYLVVENSNTGSTNIDITDGASHILQSDKLGIYTGTASSPTTTFSNELQKGADFSGSINGIAIKSSSNTLDGAIAGLTVTAKGTGTTTITIGNDTESIKDKIQDFLDAYNSLQDTIDEYGKVEMNSAGDSVESSGVLQGDPLLARLKTKVENMMLSVQSNSSVVDSAVNSLYKIGIWTTDSNSVDSEDSEDNSSDNNREFAIVDDDALDAALENYFDDVKNLFRYSSSSSTTSSGIARQMDSYLTDIVDPGDGSLTLTINDLKETITKENGEIDTMYDDLATYETELWEHYAVMEDMVSSINSALTYLLSTLGVS